MLKTSFFSNLAIKQATEKFFENGKFIKKLVEEAIEEEQRRVQLLYIKYNYPEFSLNIEAHKLKTNFKNATDSIGCGCDLCRNRFYYVAAKRNIKWFEKCFLEDTYYGYFQEVYERESYHTGFPGISENAFYDYKMHDLQTVLKSYEIAYKKTEVKFKEIGLNN